MARNTIKRCLITYRKEWLKVMPPVWESQRWQWWQAWWRRRAKMWLCTQCVYCVPDQGWLTEVDGFWGIYKINKHPKRALFFGVSQMSVFFKRANFASSIYLCSFESRGIYIIAYIYIYILYTMNSIQYLQSNIYPNHGEPIPWLGYMYI